MGRPKRIAYWALHYGKEYLAWSVRSVQDEMDELHFLYSPRPSFGYESGMACPDTEEELRMEAARFATKPIIWHRSDGWRAENQHRGSIEQIAKNVGAETVLVVDADEVWPRAALVGALQEAEATEAFQFLPRFVHFWRSFNWVCEDPSRPVRIVRYGKTGHHFLGQVDPVLHFGYAQSEELTKYKISIHGHKSEWRPEWMEKKFMAWHPGDGMVDVHPTCGFNNTFNDYFWTPRPIQRDILRVVNETLHDHPYSGKDVIR